jgi:hypothetical protein
LTTAPRLEKVTRYRSFSTTKVVSSLAARGGVWAAVSDGGAEDKVAAVPDEVFAGLAGFAAGFAPGFELVERDSAAAGGRGVTGGLYM